MLGRPDNIENRFLMGVIKTNQTTILHVHGVYLNYIYMYMYMYTNNRYFALLSYYTHTLVTCTCVHIHMYMYMHFLMYPSQKQPFLPVKS